MCVYIYIYIKKKSEGWSHLNSLPVIIYCAVRLTHWTQGFEAALGENLEVGAQTLVAL